MQASATTSAARPAVRPETARLIRKSVSANTRRSYRSALAAFARWSEAGGEDVTDEVLADYVRHLRDAGKSPASAAMAAAALNFQAQWKHGRPRPAGKLTAAALKGFRREYAAEKGGPRQAQAVTRDQIRDVIRDARKRGGRAGLTDAAIAALLFYAGLRRSEAARLRWEDLSDAERGGLLVRVRRSKANQEGAVEDVRFVPPSAARSVRDLAALAGEPPRAEDTVLGLTAWSVNRRFRRAARSSGVEGRVSAHSGRVGLASELVRRRQSTVGVMAAGGWRTARMVQRYSAGVSAESGAVADCWGSD